MLNKLSSIDEFCKENNLPKAMRLKIREFIKTSSEFQGFKWSDKKEMFFELPINLRCEIAKTMYGASANFLSFFKFKNLSFVGSVMPFLSYAMLCKEEFLYKQGDFAESIYFLIKGKVSLIDEVENINVCNVFPGGHFGDIEVVLSKKRIYSAFTRIRCNILVMNFETLEDIKNNFQSVWEDMKAEAYVSEKIFEMLETKAIEIENHYQKVPDEELLNFVYGNVDQEFYEKKYWKASTEFVQDDNEKTLMNLEKVMLKFDKIDRLHKSIDLESRKLLARLSQNARPVSILNNTDNE